GGHYAIDVGPVVVDPFVLATIGLAVAFSNDLQTDFGFEITIFVYPHASRLRSAAARLWPALGPPAREHKPVAAFTPPLWAGLTLTGVREPADVARLRGWRGCHAVDVEIRAPESLLPEAEALAKRLFGTLETASCPIHRDDVGILAALAAALCAAAFGLWRRSR
ncbi:MAG: hypothetical protein AAF772_18035, partial [Acidobacteriota bacterium]